MEETKTEKTIEQVTNEHNNACFKAGILQYRIEIHKQELMTLNQTINQLNQEAFQLNEISRKAEALKKKDETTHATNEIKEVANG